MKKLSRKHKIALVELVVILAVAVYFFFPRPLSSALGSGFDPDAVTGGAGGLDRLRRGGREGAEPSPFA